MPGRTIDERRRVENNSSFRFGVRHMSTRFALWSMVALVAVFVVGAAIGGVWDRNDTAGAITVGMWGISLVGLALVTALWGWSIFRRPTRRAA